jgi:hypothetical protein
MRVLPKKYFGTPFNRAQIVQMQEMLGLERKEYAVQVAVNIGVNLELCSQIYEARRRISDVKAAKRQLGRIAVMAGDLARLLEDEPFAEDLIRRPGSFLERRGPDGVIDMPALRAEDQKKVADLIVGLRTISDMAEHYVSDDTAFRGVQWLPPLRDAGKRPEVFWLWPRLFEIWELAGRQVAGTKDGPLHRFVSFVHHVCELPSVSASTLRDSVAEWKRDGSRAKIAEGPPWWIAGED